MSERALAKLSEKRLLAQARTLRNEALAEVYDRYSHDLYRYAVRLLSNPDAAEECVAETFSRFLHSLHQGKGPRDYLRAYLYRVAHNWINDYYRRQPPPSEPLPIDLPSSNNLQATVEQNVQRQQLRAALVELTPDQRQVILLKFYEGWKNREIAASLGKPVGAVKSLQHRGLAALQRVLKTEIGAAVMASEMVMRQ